jgi:hypothetical protein
MRFRGPISTLLWIFMAHAAFGRGARIVTSLTMQGPLDQLEHIHFELLAATLDIVITRGFPSGFMIKTAPLHGGRARIQRLGSHS